MVRSKNIRGGLVHSIRTNAGQTSHLQIDTAAAAGQGLHRFPGSQAPGSALDRRSMLSSLATKGRTFP